MNFTLTKFQENMFDLFLWISYILIVVSAFGFSQTAPKYLHLLDYWVRTYICLFLIWRFNPFHKVVVFTSLDRKIAFNAGVFILTTAILNQYLQPIEQKIKQSLADTIQTSSIPSSIYS